MKAVLEKILANNYDFGKERPRLTFSTEEIVCETVPERTIYGSFSIFAEEPVRGYIYSDDPRFLPEQEEFYGKSVEIRYKVNSGGMQYDSTHTGSLAVISTAGEYELPYRIAVGGRQPGSSLGEIRNLFHFANLAKADWAEARELFYSPAFRYVLKGTDSSYLTEYRGFCAVSDNDRNMENFLVVSRKKTKNATLPETDRIEMVLPRKSVRRHIKLTREGWGYIEIRIRTEGEFLSAEKELLTGADFSGNVALLEFDIDRDALIPGENRGALILTEGLDERRVEIVINAPREEPDHGGKFRRLKLMEHYLDHRCKRTSGQEWARASEQLIFEQLMNDPDDLEYRLYQVQLYIDMNRLEEAGTILERLDMLCEGRKLPPEQEAYRLYLMGLYAGDEVFTKELSARVEELYRDNEGSWRLAWAYMNMDESFDRNDRKRWLLIKSLYEEYGSCSPVMMLEAFRIIDQAPKRMDSIGGFELALVAFALRQGIMTKEFRERFALLSMEVHSFNRFMFELLTQCYEPDKSVALLEAICLHMIRGNLYGKEYFPWYQEAVERELRLSRLYEYYMMSVEPGFKGSLPRIVLMYFAYRSPLDAERKALLYANVIRHRGEYSELYEQYLQAATEFAAGQIVSGRIDDNLAYIYKKLLSGRKQEQEITDAYTDMLFVEKVSITSGSFANVVLVYDNLKDEERYPIVDGTAYVPVYSDRVCILLEDAEGVRYPDEGLYTRQKMIKDRISISRLCSREDPGTGILLYMAEQGGEALSVNAENAAWLYRLSLRDEIDEDYRVKLMLALLEYYFDNDDYPMLDDLLPRFDPVALSGVERETVVRIMVARGAYSEAFDWIVRCGVEGIDTKVLVRLCDRIMAHNDQEYDIDLLRLCKYIFKNGRYDGEILEYLLLYEKGSLKELKELWRAADSFALDVQRLLDNMMLQLLFTGEDMSEKTSIYLEHLAGGMSEDLERAYLARLSYDYFIKQEKIDEKCFDRAAYLYGLNEDLLLITVLAYLKSRESRALSGMLKHDEKCLASDLLCQLRSRGIFFPFFTSFSGIVPAYRAMSGFSFIEYRGREDSQVILHYVRETEGGEPEEYRKEEMRHVYGGIFVKSFLLFYGERIRYYITEEDGRTQKLTRSSLLEYRDEERSGDEDRFTMINNVAIARSMGDDQAFMKLYEEYDKKAYLADRLFTPLSVKKEGGR
ncbi:MAG: hypothetical protein IKI75_04185 [Lachnospiraceae bacterium]|nr:hypothetical protein [Lachnospiraceae bacterium]